MAIFSWPYSDPKTSLYFLKPKYTHPNKLFISNDDGKECKGLQLVMNEISLDRV